MIINALWKLRHCCSCEMWHDYGIIIEYLPVGQYRVAELGS